MKVKRKYVPDLVRMMAVCESNYLRLQRLLAGQQDRASYCLPLPNASEGQLAIEVLEDFAYTSSLKISHSLSSPWLADQILWVRLYHDARSAEVTGPWGKVLAGKNDYPNAQMHSPDEKLQLNLLLGEWLKHCMDHGYRQQPLQVAG
ncbi:DUF1249 domain-containing protein [Balneatrix alpica]|uniref:DUF1249 domain-containing protein n=1 Tax=Balneatrix alpica TaxID=75684 RepID=A0ABV5ZD84_9GAMM|nr:DUF1249 domain-containing protein [Balneatrix alpica]